MAAIFGVAGVLVGSGIGYLGVHRQLLQQNEQWQREQRNHLYIEALAKLRARTSQVLSTLLDKKYVQPEEEDDLLLRTQLALYGSKEVIAAEATAQDAWSQALLRLAEYVKTEDREEKSTIANTILLKYFGPLRDANHELANVMRQDMGLPPIDLPQPTPPDQV